MFLVISDASEALYSLLVRRALLDYVNNWRLPNHVTGVAFSYYAFPLHPSRDRESIAHLTLEPFC